MSYREYRYAKTLQLVMSEKKNRMKITYSEWAFFPSNFAM